MKIKTKVKAGGASGGRCGGIIIGSSAHACLIWISAACGRGSRSLVFDVGRTTGENHMIIKSKVKAGGRCSGSSPTLPGDI